MLLKIGFNNQPLNPFVQIKFSKFSSIDSTWDHFTFNSNLINPTITKRSPKLRITHDQRDTQIEYQQNLSIRLRKCKFSKQIKVSILPSPNQCISRLEKLDKRGKRERERERADLGNHKQPDPLKYEEWYHPSTRGVIFKHADSSTMKKRPRA